MEPLVVIFVWNDEDKTEVKEYIDYFSDKLTEDVERPFSRTLNIPIFYFYNQKEDEIPPEIKVEAEKVIIYPFIGQNSVVSEKWKEYLRGLKNLPNAIIIPIALDETAFNIEEINDINFIRIFEYTDLKKERALISVAHEVYRHGFNEQGEKLTGADSALKVFLSHAKNDCRGLCLAKKLKEKIDSSQMKNFFDTTGIAPGYNFAEEIEHHIEEATMIMCNSDKYYSRYWCQREIQISKTLRRPMIEVDLIDQGTDRRFSYAGNIPVIRIEGLKGVHSEEDLLRVLEHALIETVRFYHAKKKLNEFEGFAEILCRPPEMIDLEQAINKSKETERIELVFNEIIYPDPPVYSEEVSFFEKLGIEVHTPIGKLKNTLSGKKIGVSISEPSIFELNKLGMNKKHIEKLAQAVGKYVLAGEGKLIYGGDLRENGFTRLLVEEAETLMDRLQTKDIYLINYMSFPLYNKNLEETKAFNAKYAKFLKIKEIEVDESVKSLIENEKNYIVPDNLKNRYIRAKSLTRMREEMIGECDIRICSGGRKTGYVGSMPGVLEEILIAQKKELPIFLIGGFGGITKDICQIMQGKPMPYELQQEWQQENNLGYGELLDEYEKRGEKICYEGIIEKLKVLDLKNGLSKEENKKLFASIYVDEIMKLIMKGIKTLKNK